ncbi:cell wall galactomannoprotein [Pyrenophora tritici-repentis]|uniref:HsbA domain containing protein n=2 Tax=Pyrenophora tritici-repentis TaxID=45151 RepID=A0A2W1GXT5_9PLEO|nr:uncharacterized protein PTRG_05283 [Pyrenophora tritici-repentis Pt-1C-BFP]KAA8611536.1 HsbA domain-containing protein [Pyrenophora tritici-repentis]EDU48190.1 conserved hypothetical protein [Pyrenophora tritici-repentis Pt-1C-BFP]KAF7447565.1 HsbA domain containing protein [Pyrenophora tritici-repentis]KAF7569946.1 HsbA domain containing protein [Pyrenophora tritici-repentis]KAG9382338.1 HsbA domain containing protein [Pyrenophora tritici-repentis]
MHLALPILFLPALALCMPQLLIRPTAESVIESVVNIHNAVVEQDGILQEYTGGFTPTAIVEDVKTLAGFAKIHSANRQGFRRATFAAQFSVEETVKFIDTVVATVNISIPISTQHLRAKKQVYKENGSRSVVVATLALLLYDHDTFTVAAGKNFNPGTPWDKLNQANDAANNIHGVIQSALLYYSLGLNL